MSDAADPPGDAFAPDDASALPDEELRRLLAQARATGDEPLRRLLASYITLRRLASEMLSLIEVREGGITIARTPLFSRIKHLTRRTTT